MEYTEEQLRRLKRSPASQWLAGVRPEDILREQEEAKLRQLKIKQLETEAILGKNEGTTSKIRLKKDGQRLTLVTAGGEVPIRTLRFDMQPDKLMNYLLITRPGERVTIEQLRNEAELATLIDVAELVRSAGFTGELKKAFFPICTSKEVRLDPSPLMASGKIAQIIDEIQSGENREKQ